MTFRFGRSGVAVASLVAVVMTAVITMSNVVAQEATPVPYTPGTDLRGLSGTIVSDGSSTVGPITEAVAEEFAGEAGGVQVEVSISGTGGGFERFCAGETDLQNASRSIRADEVELCRQGGVEYFEFEVAYDGIAVVVNPENDWASCLTVEQLASIWRPENTVNTWAEIDPSWPDEPITRYGPGTDSGTFDYFTAEIVGEEGVSTTDFEPSEDDNVLVEGVAGDSNALGYFGLAYYEQNSDRLKLLEVDGGNGCIAPSAETVQGLTYTPLSRPLYVYVKAESLTRPEVQEFVRYYLAHASTLAPDVGYVASPVDTYLQDQAKLEAAIAGEVGPDGPAAGDASPAAG